MQRNKRGAIKNCPSFILHFSLKNQVIPGLHFYECIGLQIIFGPGKHIAVNMMDQLVFNGKAAYLIA
jgi:hypothetical protein